MVFITWLGSVITVCFRAKICFTQTLYFDRVSNAFSLRHRTNPRHSWVCSVTQAAMHCEYENLQSFLGNYNLKFGVNG